jgi:hypothetical protein
MRAWQDSRTYWLDALSTTSMERIFVRAFSAGQPRGRGVHKMGENGPRAFLRVSVEEQCDRLFRRRK